MVGQVKFGAAGGWQVERGVVQLDEADLQARTVVAHAPGEGKLAAVVEAEALQDGLPVACFHLDERVLRVEPEVEAVRFGVELAL